MKMDISLSLDTDANQIILITSDEDGIEFRFGERWNDDDELSDEHKKMMPLYLNEAAVTELIIMLTKAIEHQQRK